MIAWEIRRFGTSCPSAVVEYLPNRPLAHSGRSFRHGTVFHPARQSVEINQLGRSRGLAGRELRQENGFQLPPQGLHILIPAVHSAKQQADGIQRLGAVPDDLLPIAAELYAFRVFSARQCLIVIIFWTPQGASAAIPKEKDGLSFPTRRLGKR